MTDLSQLPSNLPVPQDDGAADHIVGRPVPALSLPSTSGESVALGALGPGRTVIYVYPMTGRPGVDLPVGWDDIPGARGCTPEACDFRDHHQDLVDAGADRVFGLSSQDSDYQRELVDRLRLPFAMLSDTELSLAMALDLPTFEAGGRTLFTRLTLVIRDGVIEHVFYPIFPPNEHAQQVRSWLHARGSHDPERRDTWLTATWAFVSGQLPPAPANVLEIGCGTEGGFVPRLLDAGYDALGVDPMAPAGPEYRQLDFERLDLGRRVDAVVACTSLHHVGDLDDVLTKVVESLRDKGTLVIIEWDWQRFDEATARWCFDRLEPVGPGSRHSWLHHSRDDWLASGDSWAEYVRTWATREGIHPIDTMLHALDSRFERRTLSHGPYFFAELAHTPEAAEQAAIDAGLIAATGIKYVGHPRSR
jgi:peroxiredoxin